MKFHPSGIYHWIDKNLLLQADVELKCRAHGSFWNLPTKEKCPTMRTNATSLTALLAPLIYASQPFPT